MAKKIILALLFTPFVSIVLIGCTSDNNNLAENGTIKESNQESIANDQNKTETAAYSSAEVAEHNSEDDCWMIMDSKVYDVTDYISQHPGGDRIVEGCGKEATDLFETRPTGSGPHSERARDIRGEYNIGDIRE